MCTRQNICDDDPRIAGHEIDYDDPTSLHNWVQKLDLMCEPRWKVGFISSAYFLGWCTTLLWLPVLADKYGRRNIFIAGTIIDLSLYTGILITGHIDVMITVVFLEGVAASCTQTVGWVYMMELLPLHRQAIVAAIYASWDSCITYLLVTLYFWVISNRWFPLALFGYLLQCLSVIFVWWLPESPKLLVELNRFDEAEAAMVKIASIGGTRFDPMSLNEINNGARNTMQINMNSQVQDSVGSALRPSRLKTSGLYEAEVRVPAPPLWFFLK